MKKHNKKNLMPKMLKKLNNISLYLGIYSKVFFLRKVKHNKKFGII